MGDAWIVAGAEAAHCERYDEIEDKPPQRVAGAPAARKGARPGGGAGRAAGAPSGDNGRRLMDACKRAARRLRAQPADADDAIADALLRSLERGRGIAFSSSAHLQSYVTRAVGWAFVDRLRKQHDSVPIEAIEEVCAPDDDPEAARLAAEAERVREEVVELARGNEVLAAALDGVSAKAFATLAGGGAARAYRHRAAAIERIRRDLALPRNARPRCVSPAR